MKRLYSVFALCATTLIAASAVSSPATADGRRDARRHVEQSNYQMSWNSAIRGDQRRWRDNRDRRHHKFRRHHKRHRYGHAYGRGYRQGYGYGPLRHRHGFRPGPAYAFQFDGARIILRFD
jgi:Ni/Co efflux regulator RcnB